MDNVDDLISEINFTRCLLYIGFMDYLGILIRNAVPKYNIKNEARDARRLEQFRMYN